MLDIKSGSFAATYETLAESLLFTKSEMDLTETDIRMLTQYSVANQ